MMLVTAATARDHRTDTRPFIACNPNPEWLSLTPAAVEMAHRIVAYPAAVIP